VYKPDVIAKGWQAGLGAIGHGSNLGYANVLLDDPASHGSPCAKGKNRWLKNSLL
jgi:hypothetical protein